MRLGIVFVVAMLARASLTKVRCVCVCVCVCVMLYSVASRRVRIVAHNAPEGDCPDDQPAFAAAPGEGEYIYIYIYIYMYIYIYIYI